MTPGTGSLGTLPVVLMDLISPEDRMTAVPVVQEGFEGVYRWHAKRTLRDAWRVRGARDDVGLVGVTMLERPAPEVGYIFYVAVGARWRGRGLGGRMIDDALEIFRRVGAGVAYAAAEEDNVASLALFRSRGFRRVERHEEPSYAEGGLGAWGIRHRLLVVRGEVLLGLRLPVASPGAGPFPPGAGPGDRGGARSPGGGRRSWGRFDPLFFYPQRWERAGGTTTAHRRPLHRNPP